MLLNSPSILILTSLLVAGCLQAPAAPLIPERVHDAGVSVVSALAARTGMIDPLIGNEDQMDYYNMEVTDRLDSVSVLLERGEIAGAFHQVDRAFQMAYLMNGSRYPEDVTWDEYENARDHLSGRLSAAFRPVTLPSEADVAAERYVGEAAATFSSYNFDRTASGYVEIDGVQFLPESLMANLGRAAFRLEVAEYLRLLETSQIDWPVPAVGCVQALVDKLDASLPKSGARSGTWYDVHADLATNESLRSAKLLLKSNMTLGALESAIKASVRIAIWKGASEPTRVSATAFSEAWNEAAGDVDSVPETLLLIEFSRLWRTATEDEFWSDIETRSGAFAAGVALARSPTVRSDPCGENRS